ncbi:uncharacterized protein [Euphorbia lathyris]|uniref:uncharacterized protein n=1 Tax=Euphorbia lathyris TaxID=212925 RepID=UPI0033137D0D
MVSTSFLLPINGNLLLSSQIPHLHSSSTIIKWGFRRDDDRSQVNRRTKSQAFKVLANPNVPAKGSSGKEVIMVDPVEAKRLAAKQMQEIKAKENFKRRRQIEAINGAWAMIGLTAALVIEGRTGKNIINQLAGYWSAIVHIFVQ